jgi:hypothetical protein
VHHERARTRLTPPLYGIDVIFANGQLMSRAHVCDYGSEHRWQGELSRARPVTRLRNRRLRGQGRVGDVDLVDARAGCGEIA